MSDTSPSTPFSTTASPSADARTGNAIFYPSDQRHLKAWTMYCEAELDELGVM